MTLDIVKIVVKSLASCIKISTINIDLELIDFVKMQ